MTAIFVPFSLQPGEPGRGGHVWPAQRLPGRLHQLAEHDARDSSRGGAAGAEDRAAPLLPQPPPPGGAAESGLRRAAAALRVDLVLRRLRRPQR